MLLEEGVVSFLQHRQIRGVAAQTLRLYARWLRTWLDWRSARGLPPTIESVCVVELRNFFVYLATEHIPHKTNARRPAATHVGMAPASIDSCWCILRTLWSFLEADGLLAPQQVGFFRGGRIPRPRVPQQIRPVYDSALVEGVLVACGGARTQEEAVRDQALILLLLESGARIAEVCGLDDEVVDFTQHQAPVLGKGGRRRFIYWGLRTEVALAHYLGVRSGQLGGALFRGTGSRSGHGRLTPDAARSAIKRLATRAGLELASGSPLHALRHSFAHAALDAGVDALHLQQLLGHADVTTTQRYTREHPDRLRAIHARIMAVNGKSGSLQEHQDPVE